MNTSKLKKVETEYKNEHECICTTLCKPAPNCKVRILEKMIDIILETPGGMSFICQQTKITDKCIQGSCKNCIRIYLEQQAVVKLQDRKKVNA